MSEKSEDNSREQHYQQLDKQQRQLTRHYVLFPFIILLLLMVVILATMLSLRTPIQVAIVSDFLLTLFVLCPLVICLFPLVVLMLFLIGLMNRLHSGTKSPLRRIEQWTYKMEKRVESWTGLADSQVLNWAVRFAPIQSILTIFDQPKSQDKEGGTPDGTTEAGNDATRS